MKKTAIPVCGGSATVAPVKNISFPARNEFSKILKQRIDRYFHENNLTRTGDWRMFLKTGLILVWLVASYISLVFYADTLIMAVLSALALAQGFAMAGLNIMHDGNHGSYSKNKRVNWLMGFTLDLMGGSNFFWRQKHNILHHTYTNIHDMDDDIDTGGLLRLSPNQKRQPWHRFQHIYAFPLISFLSLAWVTFTDFVKLFTGRIGNFPLRKPSPAQVVLFMLTKAFYFGYMILLPLYFHSVLPVLIAFVGIHMIEGFTLALIFQLAHTVEGNTFPVPNADTGLMENEWAIHEVETTVNFAPKNKLATWYLGGLNYQIEHHLFPQISHIHYPAISNIVEKTCKDFSINYMSYPTMRSAIAAHYRFLKLQACTSLQS